MQIHHLSSVRMAIIKNIRDESSQGYGEKRTEHGWWKIDWYIWKTEQSS
jgi:hypothetical protein